MNAARRKLSGSFYTPDPVVETLVAWAVRRSSDRLLDPSCGDGRFIAAHPHSVGIEQDPDAAHSAMQVAPWALVHEGDFFSWAAATPERFECAAGNPPFIRYQAFKGDVRHRALSLCAELGAQFSGLTSSWAPFLVAVTRVLAPGARMAFVVPAEIGHAPYSAPVLEHLVQNFEQVHVVAVRDKLFPELSEDCWLLYASGYGGSTSEIRLTVRDRFRSTQAPPRDFQLISVQEWRQVWNRRLRPYLLPAEARELYQSAVNDRASSRLGEFAQVGIGYVSGANDFFHLRPSDAERWSIPNKLLIPTVRNGKALRRKRVTSAVVDGWRRADDPVLLLRLPKKTAVPGAVKRYLDSAAGHLAREAYKCRVRDPWWSVPDVRIPDFFLTYMSGVTPSFVANDAECTCTNSVHAVTTLDPIRMQRFVRQWDTPLLQLSAELEGHPLGGGMLKLEPREAGRLLLPSPKARASSAATIIAEAVDEMRAWRHYVGT
jgi:adenine-specific DNA-methyltransferase